MYCLHLSARHVCTRMRGGWCSLTLVSVSSNLYDHNPMYACANVVSPCLDCKELGGMVTVPCAGHGAYIRIYVVMALVPSNWYVSLSVTNLPSWYLQSRVVTHIYTCFWMSLSLSPFCCLLRLWVSVQLTFSESLMDFKVSCSHVAIWALLHAVFFGSLADR